MPGATAIGVAAMKKLLLAGLAFGLVVAAGSASAADMPLKVSSPPPSPAPNWTGCYIGGNGGAALSNNNSILEAITGSPPAIPLGPSAGSAAAYGGQVGCDYQGNSNWVVGLRGMWDGTTAKSTKAVSKGL
jgi:outer membrane immunogenic protein